MAVPDSEFEAWKIAISRAAAYVQSNANFQILLFGFYSSAVAITFGTASKENSLLMQEFVIPLFSVFVLYVSCYYFNRLTTQHVFIRLYGSRYEGNTLIKSPDSLWDIFADQDNVGSLKAIEYLFTAAYTGPYRAFFLLYVGVGHASFLYAHSNNGTLGFGLLQYLPEMLISLSVSVLFIAQITTRAWRVIDYERKVKCQGYPLLANQKDRVPRKLSVATGSTKAKEPAAQNPPEGIDIKKIF